MKNAPPSREKACWLMHPPPQLDFLHAKGRPAEKGAGFSKRPTVEHAQIHSP